MQTIVPFLIAVILMSIMPILSLTRHDGNIYGKNNAAHNNSIWCKKNGGKKEVKISTENKNHAIIDCMTDRYVVKTDYVTNWEKMVGQVLYQAKITGKEPALLVLISDDYNKEKDMEDLNKIHKMNVVKIFIMYY